MWEAVKKQTKGEQGEYYEYALLNKKILFRALGESKGRVIVEEDPYLTGRECHACKGKGHTGEACPYCHGTKTFKGKEGEGPCPDCTSLGDRAFGAEGRVTYGFKLCPACDGKGTTSIIVPDDSKRPPASGTIISKSPEVTNVEVGMRVMYTNYAGNVFEPKDCPRIRVMHANEMLCELAGKIDSTIREEGFSDLEEVGMQG